MPENLWTCIHRGEAALKAAAEADKPIFNVLAVGPIIQPVQDAHVVAPGHAVTVGREFLALEGPLLRRFSSISAVCIHAAASASATFASSNT